MEPKETNTPPGVGPGITGASGDFIESTGEGQGIGGTGHDNEADAAGMRPQDRYTARPDEGRADAGATDSRVSGSESGAIGGGGPNAVQASDSPGRSADGGIGALGAISPSSARTARADPERRTRT